MSILGFDEIVLTGGLEISSEPGLGGGFWRKESCHSSQTLNHRSWLVRNPALPQNSQLCDRMDCSMPGFPVHHQLQELAQTYVHQVSDAIQRSNPLLSPPPPVFNLSQNQGLFQ